MSSHLALPRKGHLNHVWCIFSHLHKYHNAELVYDSSDLVVNPHEFELRDLTPSEFDHLKGKEEIQTSMLEPHIEGFVIR